MDTQTKAPAPVVHPANDRGRIAVSFTGSVVWLDRDELAAIVQQAYDLHGLLAQPWTAEPSSCDGTSTCESDSHHAGCVAFK